MRTPLRRSIAQVLKIARAGGRSLRQRIWSDAYRFATLALQLGSEPAPPPTPPVHVSPPGGGGGGHAVAE